MTTDPEREARDEAMERVDEAAQEYWKAAADSCIEWLATNFYDGFTAAEVHRTITQYFPDAWTHNKKAMGPRLTEAANRGVIKNTHEYRPTGSHKRPQPVWRKA